MLADRFGLKVHWEGRMQTVYALVVAKGGAKLTKGGPVEGHPAGSLMVSGAGHFRLWSSTLDQLAQILSSQVETTVRDATQISGVYDFEFDAGPVEPLQVRRMPAEPGAASGDDFSASAFTAMQAFGLKLEPRKGLVDHLVIDSALKVPTEN